MQVILQSDTLTDDSASFTQKYNTLLEELTDSTQHNPSTSTHNISVIKYSVANTSANSLSQSEASVAAIVISLLIVK